MIIHIARIFAKNIFLIPIGHAMRVVVKMDFVKKKKNFVQKTLTRWLTIFSANNSQLSYSFYYLLQNSGPRIFFFFPQKHARTRTHSFPTDLTLTICSVSSLNLTVCAATPPSREVPIVVRATSLTSHHCATHPPTTTVETQVVSLILNRTDMVKALVDHS